MKITKTMGDIVFNKAINFIKPTKGSSAGIGLFLVKYEKDVSYGKYMFCAFFGKHMFMKSEKEIFITHSFQKAE